MYRAFLIPRCQQKWRREKGRRSLLLTWKEQKEIRREGEGVSRFPIQSNASIIGVYYSKRQQNHIPVEIGYLLVCMTSFKRRLCIWRFYLIDHGLTNLIPVIKCHSPTAKSERGHSSHFVVLFTTAWIVLGDKEVSAWIQGFRGLFFRVSIGYIPKRHVMSQHRRAR